MPSEIFDIDKFISLSEKATYCTVKSSKESVKLKLRRSKDLYTLKVIPNKKEEIIKKLKCEIREI